MTTTREVWAARKAQSPTADDRQAAIEQSRKAGQASKAERKLAEAMNALKAALAKQTKAPARQYCDTPTGAPPLAWQRAYNLAKALDVGFVYLSAYDAASVEAKRGSPAVCARPTDAEKAIRAAAAGGNKP